MYRLPQAATVQSGAHRGIRVTGELHPLFGLAAVSEIVGPAKKM